MPGPQEDNTNDYKPMLKEVGTEYRGIKYYFRGINQKAGVIIILLSIQIFIVVAIPGSIAFYYYQRSSELVKVQDGRLKEREEAADNRDKALDQREKKIDLRERNVKRREDTARTKEIIYGFYEQYNR